MMVSLLSTKIEIICYFVVKGLIQCNLSIVRLVGNRVNQAGPSRLVYRNINKRDHRDHELKPLSLNLFLRARLERNKLHFLSRAKEVKKEKSQRRRRRRRKCLVHCYLFMFVPSVFLPVRCSFDKNKRRGPGKKDKEN